MSERIQAMWVAVAEAVSAILAVGAVFATVVLTIFAVARLVEWLERRAKR